MCKIHHRERAAIWSRKQESILFNAQDFIKRQSERGQFCDGPDSQERDQKGEYAFPYIVCVPFSCITGYKGITISYHIFETRHTNPAGEAKSKTRGLSSMSMLVPLRSALVVWLAARYASRCPVTKSVCQQKLNCVRSFWGANSWVPLRNSSQSG